MMAYYNELARHQPKRLLYLIVNGELSNAELTFAAESAGWIDNGLAVIPALLPLLSHESPLVREGAVYGLSNHVDENVRVAFETLAQLDESPGVREAAREALE